MRGQELKMMHTSVRGRRYIRLRRRSKAKSNLIPLIRSRCATQISPTQVALAAPTILSHLPRQNRFHVPLLKPGLIAIFLE